MKLVVKKENQSFSVEGQKKNNEYSFGIDAEGIRTKEDVEEIIRQCRLVESQLPDGMDKLKLNVNNDCVIRGRIFF